MEKNICRILKEADVGDMGIGAMIVFIAMVLVAGIAASVLVQTANRLEIQAMTTGSETTAEVATGITVLDIEGHVATDVDYLAILIGPRAGSRDVDLAQTYVEISDSSMKNVLKYKTYGGFVNKTSINGEIFTDSFYTDLNATQFGVIVIEDADGSCTWTSPVINRGDKVMLTIHCNTSKVFGGTITERVDVWGMIQPEDGCAGVFAFRTPSSYAGYTVLDLY